MGIPLPLIYLAENEDGKLIVVDGRQRLTIFFDFIDNGYKLKQLKILKELNEFDFLMLQKLYPSYVSTIEDFQLVIQVIKYPTADRVLFDIFDRVNRGGTRLNNQEMRNALYQGVATKLLRKLAGDDTFQKATGYGIKGNRMKDQYIILRALSFYLLENKYLFVHQQPYVYRSDMEDLLGKTMTFINHQKAIQDKLETIFLKVMQLSYAVLGNNAFRIMGDEDVKRRPISMTMFVSVKLGTSSK